MRNTYRLIKFIENKESSLPLGSEVYLGKTCELSTGEKIPTGWLVKQGYLEPSEKWIKEEESIHIGLLVNTIQDMIKQKEQGDYHEDNDRAHYIYEAAITCVCKKGFFNWLEK